MRSSLLVLNAGSSSLKFSVFAITETELNSDPIITGQISGLDETPHFLATNATSKVIENKNLVNDDVQHPQAFALRYLLNWLQQQLADYTIVAAGHRVVHGADKFSAPIIINANIVQELIALYPLAPLHQPYNVAGIQALSEQLPSLLQVACFDTAFHQTQSTLARMYALPAEVAFAAIKHYGFHGLSYEYIAQVLPNYLGAAAEGKIIAAHLGHGASMCALDKRQSVATTMGFTALDGLPMGTRCGSLDPGIILYLAAQQKMTIDEITQLLYEKSGLLGVSDISSDMRVLLQSEQASAKKAIALFVYRITRELGSLMAALGGLDALVFTAGIGEHAPLIRANVCEQLNWLGIKLDQQANTQNKNKLSTDASKISVWMIPTNEELMIAQHTWRLWRQS